MTEYIDSGLRKMGITISKPVLAAMCIIFGTLVILFPNFLAWIVGLFLVIQGVLLLTDYLEQQRSRTAMSMSRGVYCYSCGARNTEEAVYCKRCGTKLVQTGQIVTAQPREVVEKTLHV